MTDTNAFLIRSALWLGDLGRPAIVKQPGRVSFQYITRPDDDAKEFLLDRLCERVYILDDFNELCFIWGQLDNFN